MSIFEGLRGVPVKNGEELEPQQQLPQEKTPDVNTKSSIFEGLRGVTVQEGYNPKLDYNSDDFSEKVNQKLLNENLPDRPDLPDPNSIGRSLEEAANKTKTGTGGGEYGDNFDNKLEQITSPKLKTAASMAKNYAVGRYTPLEDLGIAAFNAGTSLYDLAKGTFFSDEKTPTADKTKEKSLKLPYASDLVSEVIDYATSGLTEEESAYEKYLPQFVAGIFGIARQGRKIQDFAKKIDSQKLDKAGQFIEKKLGLTGYTGKNVGAAVGGGLAISEAHKEHMDPIIELPLVLGSFILGGKLGGKLDTQLKLDKTLLGSLAEKIPGLKQYLKRADYSKLAESIDVDSLGKVIESSIMNKELQFMTENTFSKLPQEIQAKIIENPNLLTEEEIRTVAKLAQSDYDIYTKELEKKWRIPLTAGEHTGSAEIMAKEDYLANKSNINTFDKNMINRKQNIVRGVEKIKQSFSSKNLDNEELGKSLSNEVNYVYTQARKIRAENWKNIWKGLEDKSVIKIDNYVNKLKEFSQFKPDNTGLKTAAEVARERLAGLTETRPSYKTTDSDIPLFEQKGTRDVIVTEISPSRFEDIISGLTEKVSSLKDRTFSKAQASKLKGELMKDLDITVEAEAGGIRSGQDASIVKQARDQYKQDSEFIDSLGDSILSDTIDTAGRVVPEKMVQMLDKLPPSQLKSTFEVLSNSPKYAEVLGDVQAHFIHKALKAGLGHKGVDHFSMDAFLKALPEQSALNVIFEGNNAQEEIKEIMFLVNRIARRGVVRGNSKTAQRLDAKETSIEDNIMESGEKALQGHGVSAIKNFFSNLSSGGGTKAEKVLSEILIDPEQRHLILKEVGKQKENRFLALLANYIKS